MRTDFYYDSCGEGRLHGCRWTPEGEIKAVVQIVHGIAEFVERYDEFACYLNRRGILVVAEDHMGHGQSGGVPGYFHGGWFAAVEDTYRLLSHTRAQFPDIPYVLFGHSMGSFMARTILAKYPDSGITAAVICGTAWQPRGILSVGIGLCRLVCKTDGERNPSRKLQALLFGGYNKRVKPARTPCDWLTRDEKIVDAYMAHPQCGFVPTAGLARDMLTGMAWIQRKENLAQMRRALPVYFVAGAEDPVGNYGKGVEQAADAFVKAGMKDVRRKLWPQCRHEILNEWNRQEIYQDIYDWICQKTTVMDK